MNYDLQSLVTIFRHVLGDSVPLDATPGQLGAIASEQDSATQRRLDQALQSVGIDGWLKSLEGTHGSTGVDWVDDDTWSMEYNEEIGKRGLAYLARMVARGPVSGKVDDEKN